MRLWKGPTMSKPHSIRYIRQLMEWGFDKEFIARDAGINVESLMTRLRRAEERERNGNQRTESGTSSSQSDS
jgi:IS5 family transposase